jgi:hypothetical protein
LKRDVQILLQLILTCREHESKTRRVKFFVFDDPKLQIRILFQERQTTRTAGESGIGSAGRDIKQMRLGRVGSC